MHSRSRHFSTMRMRIVRRDFVEISAGWKLGRLPERFNPAAAGYPFVARCLHDALLDLREKIFAGFRPLEIQGHLALADSKNMTVRISEPGRNSLARQINDARFVASEFFGIGISSNENDAIALDRDCLGERLLVVNGVDISVNENSLGGFRAGRDAAHEQQDSSGSSHQPDSSVIPGENASPAGTENFFCQAVACL